MLVKSYVAQALEAAPADSCHMGCVLPLVFGQNALSVAALGQASTESCLCPLPRCVVNAYIHVTFTCTFILNSHLHSQTCIHLWVLQWQGCMAGRVLANHSCRVRAALVVDTIQASVVAPGSRVPPVLRCSCAKGKASMTTMQIITAVLLS